VAARYALSAQGATNVVRTLIDLEILVADSARGPRGAQMYSAPDVLDVILDR
jgi:hypothetical protein